MKTWIPGENLKADDLNENFNNVGKLNFSDGSDGNIIISTNTTLARDMYYNDLTINDGIILNPNGYKIYVKRDLECLGTGKIASNGLSTGAPAYTTGTLPIPVPGGIGGLGATYHGNPGGDGQDIAKSLNLLPAAAGGTGSGNYYNNNPAHSVIPGGLGGTVLGSVITKPYSFLTCDKLYDIIGGEISVFQLSPGSGGGSSGDGYTGTNLLSGVGGNGGSSGGFVWISAFNIINLNVEAIGGNGGNGGAPQHGACGGGGGGGGGNGGCIMIIYKNKGTISYSVIGGSGGIANLSGAVDGTNGEDGNDGFYKELLI